MQFYLVIKSIRTYKRGKDNKLMDALIEGGKVKYYKPEGKQRGEWILTIEAMDLLFPKRKKIIK